MLVVLPPSEGKTRPARGRPADLSRLAFPELTQRRAHLLDVLARLAAGPQDAALQALGLSPGQAGDVAHNATLRAAPAAKASLVYSGVLYERLRLSELAAPARRRVLIASALWGMVRPDDRIPAYRLSMGAKLPGHPGLAAWWKPALAEVLPDRGLVVDLRSGPYAAAWRPRRAATVAVRAFTEDGRVVSHMAKAVRGVVGRILLEASPVPRRPEDVLAAVRAAGLRAALGEGLLDVTA